MREQAALLVLDKLLTRSIRYGRVAVTDWNGRRHQYGSEGPGLHVELTDPAIVPRILKNASLAVGEGYMYGGLKIDEDDLPLFFQLITQNQPNTKLRQPHFMRARNRPEKQKDYIAAHYDVGNEYYELWLDEATRLYSCARFFEENDSLEQAQLQKIDNLLAKLQIQKGQTLLDIGCGWGHLAVAAAKKYGAIVTGITLSQEQLRGAVELARREGVADKVTFRLVNYQDLNPIDEQFDRIISVGMFEHVGRSNGDVYFTQVKNLLKPDGISVLHTITTRVQRSVSAWVDKYVFPGGYLPTVSEIEYALEGHSLESLHRESLAYHYALTCREWRRRHRENRDVIIDMFQKRHEKGEFWLPGEVFYRMRDFWLAASEAGFAVGELGLSQFIFTHWKSGASSLVNDFTA